MLALRKYERELCECGFPIALADDRANHFAVEQRTCPVCASSERYARVLHDQDERNRKQQGEQAPAAAPRPEDGRHIWLRLMAPQEITKLKAQRGGGDRGNQAGKRQA